MNKTAALLITAVLAISLSPAVSAAGSTFEAKSDYDFYDSTLYEDEYGSNYNYGGPNVTDFSGAAVLPGILSSARESVSPVPSPINYGLQSSGAPVIYSPNGEPAADVPAFSPVKELTRADGSIGTLIIPSLSISMKAYDGTSSGSMSKGVGHFPDMSAWNGNIGLCGHNRFAAYVIGSIKDMKLGDVIRYSTKLGTRNYGVTFVGAISNTDWSYLNPTSDNRITIITCLADRPDMRVCVQAVEVK